MPINEKRGFSDLKELKFDFNELEHLDQQEMRQFGADIIFASFWGSKMTAFEGDLFKFNQNLKF